MNVQLNNINENVTESLDKLMGISKDGFSTKIELKGSARGTSKVYMLTKDTDKNYGPCYTNISDYIANVISDVICIEIDESANRIYVTSKADDNHSVTVALCLLEEDIVVLDECIVNAMSNKLAIVILAKQKE